MYGKSLVGVIAVSTIALASYAATKSSTSGPDGQRVTVVNGGPTAATAPLPSIANKSANAAPAAQPAATVQAAAPTWWKPVASDTWQWQLTGTINTSYDVKAYDIDLFDAPNSVFTTLRGKGRKILCYFSAGSSEDWRADYNQFVEADQGATMNGWKGERWLNIRSANVRRIMKARLDRAVQRGCDGVEPDNVDGYKNANGVNLTAAEQLDYNRFLATEAHARGLAIALKNDLDQIPQLVGSFDLAVNEQCAEFKECGKLKPFTAVNKPVFNAEYLDDYVDNTGNARTTMCAAMRAANIRSLVLPLELNGSFRYYCG